MATTSAESLGSDRKMVTDSFELKKSLKKLQEFPKEDQEIFDKLNRELKLTTSLFRELIELLYEINKRDKVGITEFLRQKQFSSLLQNKTLQRKDKAKQFRESLFELRFPSFSNPNKTGIHYDQDSPKLILKKQNFIWKEHKGKFLKPCPGTRKHICCGYLVINTGVGCPFNCTYCYLPSYMNFDEPTLFNNQKDLIAELKNFISKKTMLSFRIGTGEFSDSLFSQLEELNRNLIKIFADQERHLLELKTKGNEIDFLLPLKHNRKTVIAWSLNPDIIIANEELGTVSLDERLKAAKKCAEAGYPIAFHFDPIIHFKNWQESYSKVIEAIFKNIPEKSVYWISLGVLRYLPALKEYIFKNYPFSKVPLAELKMDKDKKLRYTEEVRLILLKHIYNEIRKYSKWVFVYLCMENNDVWEEVDIKNSSDHPMNRYFRFVKR